MKETEEYILGRGLKGSERLVIQQEILGAGSKAILAKAGLKAGMNVLEVGCGIGLMTSIIAEQIGPEGTLTAIDISDDQLTLAKENCANSVMNIDFRKMNILEEDASFLGKYDFVYARLVLGHLSDPVLALKNMFNYLKKSGTMVCEETIHEAGLCEPPSQTIDTFFELINRLQKLLGQVQQGHLMLDHFNKMGLKNIRASLSQPTLESPRKRQLLSLGLKEMRPSFFKHNLMTDDELDGLGDQIDQFCDQDGFSGYIRITQIFGCKPF